MVLLRKINTPQHNVCTKSLGSIRWELEQAKNELGRAKLTEQYDPRIHQNVIDEANEANTTIEALHVKLRHLGHIGGKDFGRESIGLANIQASIQNAIEPHQRKLSAIKDNAVSVPFYEQKIEQLKQAEKQRLDQIKRFKGSFWGTLPQSKDKIEEAKRIYNAGGLPDPVFDAELKRKYAEQVKRWAVENDVKLAAIGSCTYHIHGIKHFELRTSYLRRVVEDHTRIDGITRGDVLDAACPALHVTLPASDISDLIEQYDIGISTYRADIKPLGVEIESDFSRAEGSIILAKSEMDEAE